MRKKLAIFTVLATLIILSTLAVTWNEAGALFVNDTSISFGKQGIFVPAGLSTDNYALDKISPGQFRGAPVIFKRPLLEVEIRSNTGQRLSFPFSMTYVWYTLSGGETRQWEKGNLGIYYRDLTTGQWRPCQTAAVHSPSGEEGEAKVITTLSCVAQQATVFGLGKSRSDE